MGFKKGSSLGVSGGITEPIQIVLKNDKKGLGREIASPKKLKVSHSNIESVNIDPLEFRSNISSKYEIKQIRDDVLKARKVIEQMDLVHDKPQNELWPTRSEEFVESEFDLLNPQMQLKQTILYLRSVYRYCLYCGCRFDTEKEMDDECAGENRGDHE